MFLARLLLLAAAHSVASRPDLADRILRIMDLPDRPPPRPRRAAAAAPAHIPDYIWALYHSSPTTTRPRTIHSYYAKEFLVSTTETKLITLSFNIAHLPAKETLRDAEIRLFIPQLPSWGDSQARINVFEVISAQNQVHRLLDTKLLRMNNQSDHVALSVKPAAARILSHYAPHQSNNYFNLTLRLQITDFNGVIADPSPFLRASRSHTATPPMLIVEGLDLAPRRRTKRNQAHQDARDKRRMNSRPPRSRRSRERDIRRRLALQARRQLCRRHRLYVDFRELNWHDWILAPRGFEAFYCDGKCPWPIMDTRNASNHAIVQALIHSVSHVVPQPCCVPSDLTSLSLLYLDYSDRIVIKNYPDMIVEGCGCA